LNSAMRHRRPGHTNSPSRSYRDPGRERRNPNQTASNIGVRRCGCPSPAESGYRDAHGMGWEDGAHLSLQPASQHRDASAVEVSASHKTTPLTPILGCPNQPSPGSPGGWLGQGAKAGAGGDVPPPVSVLSTALRCPAMRWDGARGTQSPCALTLTLTPTPTLTLRWRAAECQRLVGRGGPGRGAGVPSS
jgi:hypothetical protein